MDKLFRISIEKSPSGKVQFQKGCIATLLKAAENNARKERELGKKSEEEISL